MQGNRVHLQKAAYDIYIGRPSVWGNPFKVGKDGTRKECIEKYEVYVRNNPKLMLMAQALKGKTLGCWCQPHQLCHGDVLLKIANEG